jgi:hypothetical protein
VQLRQIPPPRRFTCRDAEFRDQVTGPDTAELMRVMDPAQAEFVTVCRERGQGREI